MGKIAPNKLQLQWSILDREAVFRSSIFTLFRSKRQLPDAQNLGHKNHKIGNFYYLDAADWVTVIPLIRNLETQQYDVILVEQFRHGSEQLVLEFPAGAIDKGEEPWQCARRELAEETGYSKVLLCEQLGASYPNPAIMSNKTFTYLILLDETVKRQEPQLDELEALQSHRLPLAKLKPLIFAADSTFNNALMLQALFWLENSKLFVRLNLAN